MVRHPTDSTIKYIWNPLIREYPDDPEVVKIGLTLLGADLPTSHPEWPSMWLDMWAQQKNEFLVKRGADWLLGHGGLNRAWQNVWKSLWNEHGPTDQLVSLATAGLKRQEEKFGKRSDSGAWRVIWPAVWTSDKRPADLIQMAINRLRRERQPVPDFWVSVARGLAQEGHLPEELQALMSGQAPEEEWDEADCRRIADMPLSHMDWVSEWQRGWEHKDCQMLLVGPGIQWLRAHHQSKAFPHIFRRVRSFDRETEAVIEVGREWLRRGSSARSGWGFVFHGVIISRDSDADIVDEARKWVDQKFLRRNTWPLVWITLWDFNLDHRERLLTAAKKWLAFPDPARSEYGAVWCRAWDATTDRTQLTLLGRDFLLLPGVYTDQDKVKHRLASEEGPKRV
jgi:hypothetical protein